MRVAENKDAILVPVQGKICICSRPNLKKEHDKPVKPNLACPPRPGCDDLENFSKPLKTFSSYPHTMDDCHDINQIMRLALKDYSRKTH